MQVLIAPADCDWQSESEQLRRKLHVLYQFGLALELRMCILPSQSHSLDQFIVTGALSERGSPSINVRLSTAQLRTLTTIARNVVGDPPRAGQSSHLGSPSGSGIGSPLKETPNSRFVTPQKGSLSMSRASAMSSSSSSAVNTTARAELAIQNIIIVLSDESPSRPGDPSQPGEERELAMLRTSNISLQFAQLKTSRIARFSLESLMMEDRTPRPTRRLAFVELLDSRPPPSVLLHALLHWTSPTMLKVSSRHHRS